MTHLHLHGGQKKTGTTALQAFLEQHHLSLAKRGLDVAIANRGAAGHHALVSELGSPMGTDNARHYRQLFRRPLLPEFRKQVARGGGRPLILSSEIFGKRVLVGDAPAMLAALFDCGITTIELHIFVRSPLGYVNSDYSQVTKMLKTGGLSFQQHAEATLTDNVATLARLSELSDIAGVSVRFHPYTSAVMTRGTARTLFEAIGIDPAGLPDEARLNLPIGPLSLEAMRRIGARLRPDAPFTARQRIAQSMLAIAARQDEEEAWLIDPSFVTAHHDALAEMDKWTRRVWGVEWREVFGDDANWRYNNFTPDFADSVSRARFDAILASFIEIARREGAW